MPFDISTALTRLVSDRRAAYIKVGKQYSSADTLRQASLTGQGFERYGKEVSQFGFVQRDADALGAARAALQQASAGREEGRVERKQASAALAQAVEQAKRVRLQARSVLEAVRSELTDSGNPAAEALDSVLVHTRSAGRDPQKLAHQLTLLAGQLEVKEVGLEAKGRGGPAVAAQIKSAHSALLTLESQAPVGAGTTADTEQMDLLDGYIVELARRARRASRAAAKALGRPDIARAFELTALDKASGSGPIEPAPGPSPPPSP